MEPDQIDILTFAMLRDFKQIQDTQETRLASQLGRDVRKTYRRNRIDLYFTFVHGVPATHFDVRMRPYADAARNIAAAYSFT